MSINFNKAAKYLIVVAGPTASGKTSLAIALAQYFNTAIISCDSRQFYREMNIGTAKPNAEELAQAPHHFINNLSIFDTYNVGDYEREVLQLLEQLFKDNNIVILTGGSGLFMRAICEGLDHFPVVDTAIRTEIVAQYNKQGITYLQQQLQQLDPPYFAEVDQQNSQRLIRALEICLGTGKPFSSFRTHTKVERPFSCIKVAINFSDRQMLYKRINKRVELMLQTGLLEEVKKLHIHKNLNALQTVGYQELFDYFDGKIVLEEAIRLIKRNTRRYAKRQLTWLRKEKNVHWVTPNDITTTIQLLKEQMR